jgi:Asp-tRNA(Asn)/Glu-tRNA(Gln) amidotransferase A subunit family amidase
VEAYTAEREVRERLERIGARDSFLRAWAFLAPERALADARRSDALPPGPLHGWTVGVKDIIDVEGMPTTWGSCIALTRRTGAVILGKTVSTEFAFATPSRTRNPWDSTRTPGGSSSGSAAAVADGHVRVGFATQTQGSVLRPAAFCGVVGYKPTYRTVTLEGIRSCSVSTDTLGWIARSVADAARFREALLDLPALDLDAPAPAFGWYRGHAWAQVEPAMQELLTRVAAENGADEVDFGFADLEDVFLPIAFYEQRQAMATEALQYHDELSPELRAVTDATEWTYPRYLEALARLRAFDVDRAFGRAQVLLMPAALGEAPNPTTTGNPIMNRLASLLGLPAITIPGGLGPNELPLGLQLIARPHRDDLVLRAAHALAQRIGFSAKPREERVAAE